MYKNTLRDWLDVYSISETMQSEAPDYKNGDLTLMLQDYILDERLNRDDLNSYILLKLGMRVPLYNDTTQLKLAFDTWFSTHEYNITKLVDTMEVETNPLYNKDLREEIVRNENSKKETDYNSGRGLTSAENISEVENTEENLEHGKFNNRTGIDTTERVYDVGMGGETVPYEVVQSGSEVTLESTSAYDSENWVNSAKTERQPNSLKETHTGGWRDTESYLNVKDEEGGTDTTTTDRTNAIGKGINESEFIDSDETRQEEEHEGIQKRKYGIDNIKSVAELIEEARKAALFNIYDWIIEQLDEEIFLGIFAW